MASAKARREMARKKEQAQFDDTKKNFNHQQTIAQLMSQTSVLSLDSSGNQKDSSKKLMMSQKILEKKSTLDRIKRERITIKAKKEKIELLKAKKIQELVKLETNRLLCVFKPDFFKRNFEYEKPWLFPHYISLVYRIGF
jgi:hypothetical protein